MSYQVTIVAQDGAQSEIQERPSSFEIEWDTESKVWKVCLAWCRDSLADADDEDALDAVWPDTSSVKVWRHREEIFTGKVTKIGVKDEKFVVEASTERPDEPQPGEDMLITVATDEPGSHNTLITVDNRTHGPVSVDFGDGSAVVTNAGDGVATSAHTYSAMGTYTVVATDVSNPERQGRATVVIPHEAGS